MITVVIPTYNRPACIDYILKHSFSMYKGHLFQFSIHDSSENDSTEKMIQKYNESHDNKIAYYRYPSDISGDVKSYIALKGTKSDYLYLMGDGIAPDFNALEALLIRNKFFLFDFVGVLPSCYRGTTEQECPENNVLYVFSNLLDFTSKFFYRETLYGGSIIHHRLIDFIDENQIFDKFRFDNRFCYAYITSIFTVLSMNSNFTFCISFDDCLLLNPEKKGNWAHDDNLYKILFEEFQNDVNLLPPYYDGIKSQILLSRNQFAWGGKNIIYYRKINSLNFGYLKKYKSALKVCDYNYFFTVFVCFIPRFVFVLMSKAKNLARRLLKKR